MPNFIDIAQRFAEQPAVALLHEERCLQERDLASKCSHCAETCPVDAIELAGNVLSGGAIGYGSVEKKESTGPRIDEEACVRCGRCITACPTAALVAVAPLDDDTLLKDAAQVGDAALALHREPAEPPEDADGPLPACGFACTRATRAARIDAERVAVLPCLAWVDEALIVHAACAGAPRVVLLAAPCASCEHRAAVAELPAHATEAQRILDTWNIACEVVYAEQGAEGLAAPLDADAAGELSRRGLFTQARMAALDAAAESAKTQMDALVGTRVDDAPPPEPDRRRWQLLDDLHAVGLPASDTVVPRSLAPRVDIDAERCSGCALCAGFCPTEALRKVGKVAGGRTLLEFDAALCRDCGTCTDTCRYGAIGREESLTVSELFALEPHAIVIPKRRVLPSRR